MSTLRQRRSKNEDEHEEDSSKESFVPITDQEEGDDGATKETLAIQPKSNAKRASIDQLLQRLTQFLSRSINQDKTLSFLQWNCWMLSHLLKSKSFRKLYSDLSWARYATRLLGLPACLDAIRNGSWCADSKSKHHRVVGQLMAWSMVFYYSLEHLAYVKWMLPENKRIRPTSVAAEKLSAWSCRFWFLYMLTEVYQTFLPKHNSPSEISKRSKLQIGRNLLFALPCVHWSLPKWDTEPWLPETVVHTLMLLESYLNLYQSNF